MCSSRWLIRWFIWPLAHSHLRSACLHGPRNENASTERFTCDAQLGLYVGGARRALALGTIFFQIRGSIRVSANAVREVVERVWIRGADSPPPASVFSLLPRAVHVRSNVGRQNRTQINSRFGGAANPCCQTLPRFLTGALHIPSFATTRSAFRALRPFLRSSRVVRAHYVSSKSVLCRAPSYWRAPHVWLP